MSVRTSSIPYVKKQLATVTFPGALATAGVDPNPDGPVQVVYGNDAVPKYDREVVIVGDVPKPDEIQFWQLGGGNRRELYDIDVDLLIAWPGASAQDVTERAFTILGLLETTLVADPTIGLTGPGPGQLIHLEVQVAQPAIRTGPLDQATLAHLQWQVRVYARI